MVCQNFKFLCWIHAQIDFRSLHGRMAEPKQHLSKVAGGFKDMYGAGMAQDMCSDMLAGYGWLDFLCGLNMSRQQVCKALTGHCCCFLNKNNTGCDTNPVVSVKSLQYRFINLAERNPFLIQPHDEVKAAMANVLACARRIDLRRQPCQERFKQPQMIFQFAWIRRFPAMFQKKPNQ